MFFRQLFDPETSTFTYLLADIEAHEAVLIDPVRSQVDRDAGLLQELGLRLVATLETHVHADHVTGAWLLKQKLGSDIIYSQPSGVQGADRLVDQGDRVTFGRHSLEVRLTPGHTAGCASYVTDDAKMAFTGDAVMVRGCGRTDFQQGDARKLYRSVHEQIFTLPDKTLIYPGHDYQGRTATAVCEETHYNPRLGQGRTEDEFVEIMANLKLNPPRHIHVAVPANLQLGRMQGDPEILPHPNKIWRGVTRSPTGAPHVQPDWVHERTAHVRLIDVRSPEEYVGPLGHVSGSELVPMLELQHAAQHWDPEEPVVLICRSSGRSDRAARLLEDQGFYRVASMVGGMLKWRREQRPAVMGL